MPFCAVKWCGKSSTTSSLDKDGITFHRFPKNPETKRIWIDATKRDESWFPTTNNVICSRHFTADCFRHIKKRRLLFDSAVPTIMLPTLTSAPAQGAVAGVIAEQPSTSTSAQHDVESVGETSPLNSDDDDPDDAPQSEPGDDLSLYITLPKKSAESLTVSARKNLPEKRDDLRHDGFTCNSCSRDIVGYRYTCVQCPEYDLCSSCEARGAHCLHYVLRIPKPAPYAEIQSMLNAIRCQLLFGGSKQPEPDFEPNPEPEPDTQEEPCVETFKLEIKEEPDPLQTDDAFQADHHYPDASYTDMDTESPMPAKTTQPIQTSQPAYDTAMTAEMFQGNTLLIIENPVSASSAAAHTAAGADRTKRKLAHRSAAPPHVSEKRLRLIQQAQGSANQFIEVPITGTVPVTTVPQSPAAVLVTTGPTAPGTSATGGRGVKEESTFQVFSHSKIEPKKPRAKPGQIAGKASTSQSFLTRLI